MTAVTIRPMRPADTDAVMTIYQAGLDTGHASFETRAPDWATFDAADQVLGWVACVPVSDRCAYAGVVEHSVYVHPAAQRRGVGAALLDALISTTEAAGVWTIQSGVFPTNTPSLALHQRAGFRTVGVRERLGRHPHDGGAWRDVILIERRSPTIT